MRPNSPPQMTNVSSSNPRRLRSLNNAAVALSASAQRTAVPVVVRRMCVPRLLVVFRDIVDLYEANVGFN